jgi:hypothetical protein
MVPEGLSLNPLIVMCQVTGPGDPARSDKPHQRSSEAHCSH